MRKEKGTIFFLLLYYFLLNIAFKEADSIFLTIFFIMVGISIFSLGTNIEKNVFFFQTNEYYVTNQKILGFFFGYQCFLSLLGFMVCMLLSHKITDVVAIDTRFFFLFFLLPFCNTLKQWLKGHQISFPVKILKYLYFLSCLISLLWIKERLSYMNFIFYDSFFFLFLIFLIFLFLFIKNYKNFHFFSRKKREERKYDSKNLGLQILWNSKNNYLFLGIFFLCTEFLGSSYFLIDKIETAKVSSFFSYRFCFRPLFFLTITSIILKIISKQKKDKEAMLMYFYFLIPLCFFLSFFYQSIFSFLKEPSYIKYSIFELISFSGIYYLLYFLKKKKNYDKKFFGFLIFGYLCSFLFLRFCNFFPPTEEYNVYHFFFLSFCFFLFLKKNEKKEMSIFRYHFLKIILCSFIIYAINLNLFQFLSFKSKGIFLFYLPLDICLYGFITYKTGLMKRIFYK